MHTWLHKRGEGVVEAKNEALGTFENLEHLVGPLQNLTWHEILCIFL